MLKTKNYDQESKKTKQILHYVMCNGNVYLMKMKNKRGFYSLATERIKYENIVLLSMLSMPARLNIFLFFYFKMDALRPPIGL